LEPHHAILEQQVLIAWRDVDGADLEGLAVDRLDDTHQCPAAQDPSQAALGHRATVEDHGDRRRNVTWQQGKEEAQRFDTARGCPDRDDVATNPFGIDH